MVGNFGLECVEWTQELVIFLWFYGWLQIASKGLYCMYKNG